MTADSPKRPTPPPPPDWLYGRAPASPPATVQLTIPRESIGTVRLALMLLSRDRERAPQYADLVAPDARASYLADAAAQVQQLAELSATLTQLETATAARTAVPA